MEGLKQDVQERDAIDFAGGDVRTVFRRMLLPTLLGMVSMVVLNLADGAFVGHGAGTEALAAINIAAPIFNIMTGIGIMFGVGSSVISSIHLSKGNVKAARINVTQALLGSFVLMSLISALILFNLPLTCRLFGSSDALVPLAGSYLRWVALCMPLNMLGMVGEFIVRLDGSPRFAMSCTLVACILNIVLDWVFIFPLGMGIEGAAIATSVSFSLSALIVFYYICFRARTLHLYRLRLTFKSLVLTLRNLWYQIKAGFSGMLGEIAISGALITGNYVFIRHLGEVGVAAYSVVCYCMPVIFMLSNAIVQSMQPISSFAYGAGDAARLRESRNVSIFSAIVAGTASTVILTIGAPAITGIFMSPDEPAYALCVNGMPYFGAGALLMSLNLVLVGYLQSIEKSLLATIYTVLRGFVIVIPAFIFLPGLFGTAGIWLAIPAAEAITLIVMSVAMAAGNSRQCNDR